MINICLSTGMYIQQRKGFERPGGNWRDYVEYYGSEQVLLRGNFHDMRCKYDWNELYKFHGKINVA